MSVDLEGDRTPARSEVAVERTWDAASVFTTVADWDAEVDSIVADLPGVEAFEGRLAEGASVVIEALEARDELMRRVGRVLTYASVSYAVDTTDPDGVARFGRARALAGQVAAATAFVEPELHALGRARLREWSAGDPTFDQYDHYFDDLFRRGEHIRSTEVEELLGLVLDAHSGAYAVYSSLADSELVFGAAMGQSGETAEVTQGSIRSLLGNPDRVLRRRAWESYTDGYRAFRNVFAATYATAIKQDVFSARARRHASTCAAALHKSNIPLEVLDSLLVTFVRNLPTWHRYWECAKRCSASTRYDLTTCGLRSAGPDLSFRTSSA